MGPMGTSKSKSRKTRELARSPGFICHRRRRLRSKGTSTNDFLVVVRSIVTSNCSPIAKCDCRTWHIGLGASKPREDQQRASQRVRTAKATPAEVGRGQIETGFLREIRLCALSRARTPATVSESVAEPVQSNECETAPSHENNRRRRCPASDSVRGRPSASAHTVASHAPVAPSRLRLNALEIRIPQSWRPREHRNRPRRRPDRCARPDKCPRATCDDAASNWSKTLDGRESRGRCDVGASAVGALGAQRGSAKSRRESSGGCGRNA